jgi:hypothetical protein
VTGNAGGYGRSIPELAEQRNLPVSWTLHTAQDGLCQGGFYCEGSVLASALWELSNTPGQTALQIAKRVFATQKAWRSEWLATRDSKLVFFSSFLNIFLKQAGGQKELECQIFNKWFDTDTERASLTCPK